MSTSTMEKPSTVASESQATQGRRGRAAYETPPKHATVLKRSGARVDNAKRALAEAQDAMYDKVVAALGEGVKPAAIQRSLGQSPAAMRALLNRAKAEGHIA